MVREYNFVKDLEKNDELYKNRFISFLKKKCQVKPQDIKTPEGYFPDYDIVTPYGTYEIKRDYRISETRNFLIEFWYNEEQKKSGWFKHSKANFLVYFYTDFDFIMVRMDLLRADFEKGDLWKENRIQQEQGFHTLNFLKPIQSMKQLIIYGKA
jgi:hypothetical protein